MKTEREELMNWVLPIYKPRWIGISIRYDDFYRFIYDFFIPFVSKAEEEGIIESYYYNLGLAADDVIQINIKTTQYKLERGLKKILFAELNKYFDHSFLSGFGIKEINESSLDQKSGVGNLDLKNLRIIGIEEYYINPITFSIGTKGGQLMINLSRISSNHILGLIKNNGEAWTVDDSIETSLSLHYTVLKEFMKNESEMISFMSWVMDAILSQIKEIPDIENLEIWKAEIKVDMEQNFLNQKDQLVGFSKYFLDHLDTLEKLDEEWLNDWRDSLRKCKDDLNECKKQGKLPMLYDMKQDMENLSSSFNDIDDSTLQKWQIVYYILNTTNGQLGLRFNLEYYLYYFIMRSLTEIIKEVEVEC